MKSAIIAIASLTIILAGTLMLSLTQLWPAPEVQPAQGLLWLTPLAYFLMLAGAGGLAWGLVKKHRQ
ncbi:hypothetical protein AB2B41_03110 [Marimonas sp. MJW-29]|uniref:DUF3955 domain-containing protein n=1 Tax=Sulfitobacter sediminis TaxID=3234186 RepID=A0ABV3RHY6_9RHOB